MRARLGITIQQALEGLNDVVAPEPVSLVPRTVGWWVLAAVVVTTLVALTALAWQRYRRHAYRRAALAMVESTPLTELPALLKRVALAAAPRTDVASLTGDAWLAFLDRTGGGVDFTNGPGRKLASVSYAPAPEDSATVTELRTLAARWVRTHRV